MSDLGSLYFSLGLDSDKFDKAIEAARKKVSDLGANVDIGFKVDVEDVGRQVQDQLKKLQSGSFNLKAKADDSEIQELKQSLSEASKELESLTNAKVKDNGAIDRVTKKVEHFTKLLREAESAGQSKPIGLKVELEQNSITVVRDQLAKLGHPVNVKITLDYDIEKFRAVETTLKNYAQNLTSVGNIKLGIDDSFLRTGMSATTEKGLKGWLGKVSDYLLGDDTGDAAKSVQQIQKILDSHPFKIKVTFDQQALISTMNKSLKGLPVKVDVDVAELQKKLKALKIPLAFNISQAINEAKAELKKKSFDAKLNLVIDRAKVSKAIKEAFAKKGLEYQASPADVRNARILEIQQRMEQSQKKFDGHVKKSTQSTNKLGSSMKVTADWAGQLANQFSNFISIYSIERFIRNLYTIGGEFQKQQIALRNMIGDATKADSTFERLKDLAVVSPFTFSELSSYTKQMAAYGIEYEELYDTTKRLADISAGIGVDMGRLILAYGQVRSAEVLRGQELRQFTEAGIPLVAELATRLSEVRGESVKVGEVFDAISKRQVSFGMVKDVLFDMTDPGGRFFEMQEELAKSLAGQWSNLKDAWDIMIADIANSSNNTLSNVAGVAADILRSWRGWIPALTAIASAIGVVTSAIRVATTVTTIWNAVTSANPWAAAITVILGAAGAIGGYALASSVAEKNTAQVNEELEAQIQKWSENRSNALRYIDTIKSSNTSEERRIQLYNELLKLYPSIFENMKMEQVLLADTASLKTRVNDATKAMSVGEITKLIEDERKKIRETEKGSVERGIFNGQEYKIVRKALTDEQKAIIQKAEARIAELEAKAAEIQKNITREGLIKKLTPDSSINKYIEVYHNLAKAVKILRQGGVKGEISNPKEFTTTLKYYDQLNAALKEQEEISKKFKVGTPERTDADKLVKVYRDAITAIGGLWKTSKSKKSVDEAAKIDIQAYVEALKNEISKISSQWNLFKDLMEASGNKKLSMNIAFGGQISFESQLEQLRSRIMEEAKKFKVGIGLYDLLGMGEKQLLDAGVEEKAAKALGSLIKAYNDENKKLKDESVKNFIEILNSSRDFAQQIVDIERELQKDLADLRSNAKGMSAEELKRRENELIRMAEEDKAKVQFEEFKKSSDWVKVFDDLDRVSDATLDKMIKDVERFAAETNLGVKETKELVEALGKLRDEAIDRNPFQGFEDAWNRLKELKQIIKNGTLVAGGTQYRTGSGTNDDPYVFHSKKEVEDGVADANKDLEDSALGVASKFDAVAKAADLLGGLFENMGLGASNFMSALSDIAGGIAGGAQSGAGIAAAFGATGPWGAIIGAGIGALSALFAQVDKSLQRGIDASERREKEIGNVAEMLEKSLERNMGGIFTMKIDDTTAAAFNKIVNSYNETQSAIKEWNSGETNMDLYRQIREFLHLQKDTIDTIKEALEEDSYFDAQLAALKVQRDEVQKQMDLEDEKKKTDKDKMLDYQKQIAELDDSITHFAEDMANSLYGIDFKDWSEQLAESLVDAWASGEDAVQAYKGTVNDILRDLGVSIISQKIIQPLLDKTMTDFLAQFEKDNGKLTDSSMNILAGMADGAEYAASATEAYLEGLKKLGIDLSDTSEEAKSGLSKGIEGVTEDTANLLGSYLNSIRADVSVKRNLIEKLVGDDIPRMNYIAEAQLRELNQIVANTKRNADAADKIYDLVNRVVDKGSNKLKV